MTPAGWPYPTYAIDQIAVADVDGNGYPDVIMTTVADDRRTLRSPTGSGSSIVIVVPRKDATTWAIAREPTTTWSDGPVTGLAVGPMRTGELPNWYTSPPGWMHVRRLA